MAAKMRTMGPSCRCVTCVIARDDFNRADEDVDPDDSTGHWHDARPDHNLHVSDSQLVGGFLGLADRYDARYATSMPRHWQASVGMQLFSDGAAQLRVVTDALKQYGVELQQSASDPPDPCGLLRLFGPGNVTLDRARVPGVTPDVMHRVKLCYDDCTKTLTGVVELARPDGGYYSSYATPQRVHAVHAFGVEIEGTIESVSLVPTVGSGGTFGYHVFDDFEISETKSGQETYVSEESGYYGYLYQCDEPNSCPACGPTGCQQDEIDFDGCYVTGDAVSVDPSGAATFAPGDSAIVQKSWSGVSPSGEKDDTTHAQATLTIVDLFAIRVGFGAPGGGPTAVFAPESAPGESDGGITLYDADGNVVGAVSDVAIPSGSQFVASVCLYDDVLVASAGGSVTSAEVPSAPGTWVSLENVGASDAVVQDARVNHNLNSPGCPDCIGGAGGGPDNPQVGSGGFYPYPGGPSANCNKPENHSCKDGVYPPFVFVNLSYTTTDATPLSCCPEFMELNGAHLVPIRATVDPSSPAQAAMDGYLTLPAVGDPCLCGDEVSPVPQCYVQYFTSMRVSDPCGASVLHIATAVVKFSSGYRTLLVVWSGRETAPNTYDFGTYWIGLGPVSANKPNCLTHFSGADICCANSDPFGSLPPKCGIFDMVARVYNA